MFISNLQEILRRDWMFKLVGSEGFEIGKADAKARCEIEINASSGFSYEYALLVNGKQLKKFCEKQSKVMRTWMCPIDDEKVKIALGKD